MLVKKKSLQWVNSFKPGRVVLYKVNPRGDTERILITEPVKIKNNQFYLRGDSLDYRAKCSIYLNITRDKFRDWKSREECVLLEN